MAKLREHPIGHLGVRGRKPKGPISQRKLVQVLPILIDSASAKVGSRGRDDARAALRELLATANWNTPFVLKYIRGRRARYISSLGHPIPPKYLRDFDMKGQMERWYARNG